MKKEEKIAPNVGQEAIRPSQNQSRGQNRDWILDKPVDYFVHEFPNISRQEIVTRLLHGLRDDLLIMDFDFSEMLIRPRNAEIVNDEKETSRSIIDENFEEPRPPSYTDQPQSSHQTVGAPLYPSGGLTAAFSQSSNEQPFAPYQSETDYDYVNALMGTNSPSTFPPFAGSRQQMFPGNTQTSSANPTHQQFGVASQNHGALTLSMSSAPRYPPVGPAPYPGMQVMFFVNLTNHYRWKLMLIILTQVTMITVYNLMIRFMCR